MVSKSRVKEQMMAKVALGNPVKEALTKADVDR